MGIIYIENNLLQHLHVTDRPNVTSLELCISGFKNEFIIELINMINLNKPIISFYIYEMNDFCPSYNTLALIVNSDSNDEFKITKDWYGGYDYTISKANLLEILKSIKTLINEMKTQE
jgi:hypothetical protein